MIDKFLGPEPMHPVIARILTLLIGILLGAAIIVTQNVYANAAPPATSDNCVELGTIGTVIIGRCVDPDTGREIYANSAGFIDVVED